MNEPEEKPASLENTATSFPEENLSESEGEYSAMQELSGGFKGSEDAPAEDEAVRDWKDSLRDRFETWLETIDQIPPLENEGLAEVETPDLYSFHAELAVLSTETRKANRRTAEAFSQWGETLGHFDTDLKQLREQMSRLPTPSQEESVPRGYCLALAEISDRLLRLLEGFAKTPPKSWWGGNRPWIEAWGNQLQAFEILQSHFDALLEKAGLRRMEVRGKPFDPTRMVAIATENDPGKPHQIVLEEVAPGYLLGGDVLRPAQVKVNLNKASA